MNGPVNIIADAFQRLKQSVTDDDAYDFESTRLGDVWQAVREIDNAQRQRQSAQNMRRIEPFLRALEKYSKVIEVLCNGTPYLPYVWAPIKLMLQIASHHRDVFESLLDAYKEIGDALPRFDRYEQAFKDNPAFLCVLASVYSSILEFHQRAYKFFKRRAWHVLFQSLWKDFGARFAGIVDGLKKQRDFVDREAVSIDLLESKQSRIQAQEDIEQRQKNSLLLIEQNETILSALQFQQSVAWLSVDELDQGNRYERLCQRRHNETCSWALKQPELESWMGSDAVNHIVWLTGKPGAGKSVMSSYIVSNLLQNEAVDTLYYFCSSKDDSCNLILRSLALQILRKHPDLASLISKEFFHKTCNATQIRDLLPKILATSPGARIILDGVDETTHEVQKMILRELQAVCFTNNVNCKILFSSRKEVGLARQLAKKQSIVLDGREEVNLDIQSFVSYKMEKVKTSNAALRNKIESELVKNADGMFLWVHLVVEGLRSCFSDWDLERNAKSLPKGLEAAYERILDRIQQDPAAAIAINILEWMACSHRPLRIHELLDGISFRPDNSTFHSRPKMDIDVLDLCRPLIENGPSNILDFVHFSAKEYIVKSGTKERNPFINSTEANLNLGFACVAYLNTAYPLLPNNNVSKAQQAAVVATGLHGLLPYANQHWTDHLLAYCSSTAKPLPRGLSNQLSGLIHYQKSPGVIASPQAANLTKTTEIKKLDTLDQLPQVHSLILSVRRFRDRLDAAPDLEFSETTVQDIALHERDTDPTYFTALRYNYQSTLESLLDRTSWHLFPGIERHTLSAFLDTFGSGAFTCHYPQCARAVDGFDTSRQRDTHEAAHTRQFRCNFPRCINFSTGFAKRSALNRHNKQYHQVLDKSPSSLSELINNIRSPPPLPSVKAAPGRFGSHRDATPTSIEGHARMIDLVSSDADIMLPPSTNLNSAPHEDKGNLQHILEPPVEEPYTIKCICASIEDDGNTIYCEKCDTWQHIECYYPGQVDDASREAFEHDCMDCKPRPLPIMKMTSAASADLNYLQNPSAQEIHTMRTHPSGKLAQASDEQIRAIHLENQAVQLQQAQGQMTPRQHQQRQQMIALQLSRMRQADATLLVSTDRQTKVGQMGHAQARTKRGLENPQTGSSPHHQASEISAPPDLSSPFPYQLPSYYSSSNLPKLEANFMKDFECCGQTLPGLRDLIQHYEETHATNKSSSNKLNRSEATEQPAPTTLPVANIASSIRRDIIHLLAVEALSTEALREKLPDVTFNDIEDNLKNVALRLSGGEWHLFYECWRQLDIWAFDYDWYEDRQKAIDNAVATYDAMRLESTAPEWEKLLSPEQRGKGICLSKLAPPKGISEEGAAKTRMSKPSAIDIWLTSGSSSTLTEQNQILKPNSSTDDRDGRGSPTVSGSQLPSPPRPISYAGAQEQRQKHSEVNPSWEGVDFSALLNDFGTDWVGIAQWLQTKTPEMVRSHYAHGVVNGHGEWAMIVERVDSSRYYPPDPFGPFYQSALPSLMGQQLHTIHPASDNDSSQPPKSNKTTTPSANDSASLSSPKQLNDAGGNRATDYGLDSFNFDRPNASGEAKEPLSHQRNAKSGHGLDFTFPNLDKFEELPRVPSSRKHPPTSDFDFSLPDRLTENTKLPAVTNFSTQGQQLGSNATRQSDSSTHTRLWEAIAHPQTNDNGAEIATPASARQSWLLQMLEETRKKRSDCKEELSHISLKRAITNRFYPPGSTVQNYPWSNSTSDMITRDNELRHAVKRLEDDEKTYSIELRELSRGL